MNQYTWCCSAWETKHYFVWPYKTTFKDWCYHQHHECAQKHPEVEREVYYTFNAEETNRVLKIGFHPENKIKINKGFNWFSLNQIYLDKTRQNPFMGRFCLIGSQWWFGLYKFTIYCNLINTCITFNTRHFTIILLKKKISLPWQIFQPLCQLLVPAVLQISAFYRWGPPEPVPSEPGWMGTTG